MRARWATCAARMIKRAGSHSQMSKAFLNSKYSLKMTPYEKMLTNVKKSIHTHKIYPIICMATIKDEKSSKLIRFAKNKEIFVAGCVFETARFPYNKGHALFALGFIRRNPQFSVDVFTRGTPREFAFQSCPWSPVSAGLCNFRLDSRVGIFKKFLATHQRKETV